MIKICPLSFPSKVISCQPNCAWLVEANNKKECSIKLLAEKLIKETAQKK